ncbi:MAG: restriction endonuclease subunit S, partial [Terriglobia bacterium]
MRIKDENPDYVAFVMNSIVGRLQTEKLCAGSAQVELYPKDIDQFIIPFISTKKQEDIVNAVNQSREHKKMSEKLLDIAKRGVEMAIED